MEDNNSKDNKKTLEEHPQYFGSFLNLARLNIVNISNHLSDRYDLMRNLNAENIKNSFLLSLNANPKINQNHIYSSLRRLMPIVKVFDFESLPENERLDKDNYGKDFNGLSESLKVLFKAISDFRDDYTHYYSKENKANKNTLISIELKGILTNNFRRAIEYTKHRFKGVFTEQDYNIVNDTTLVNGDNTITQDGLVFLTSMFLDRETAFQFIGKITGLKGTQYKNFLVKREVLMAYCVKLPNERFVSEDKAQAFSLDLLNELNKCPKSLYKVITEEGKKTFNPGLSDESIQNVLVSSVPESIDDYQVYIESIVKKVRNQNRFPYFALKYIDEKKLFKNLRFQINLGKVVLDEYEKPLNGETETRRVVENAKAFDRLQDCLDEKVAIKEIGLKELSENSVIASFEQFKPHYNIELNKIGLSFNRSFAKFETKNTDKKVKTNLKQPIVNAFLSVNELPKIILLEHLQKGKSEELIKEFINLNNSNLFNREFIDEIKNKFEELSEFKKRSQGRKARYAYSKKDAQELQLRKQRLNEVLENYNLNVKQIPGRILDYWLNIKDVEISDKLSDSIKLMKRNCIGRLKKLEKGIGPKVGEMATFLAKDIVDMVISPVKKQKITSFYYDKMQECLALYNVPEKKDLFIKICKNELKLYEKDGHPFISRIEFENYKYTSDLYKKYLQEKGKKMLRGKDVSWMEKNFYKNKNKKTVVSMPNDKSRIPFTITQLEKPEHSFDNWFNHIVKGKADSDRRRPVDLPTNLFDATLIELLKKELINSNSNFPKNAKYNELFKIWWKDVRKDDIQPFYFAKREYSFNNNEDVLQFEINSKPKFMDYYQDFAKEIFIKKQKLRKEEKQSNRRLPNIIEKEVSNSIRNKIAKTERQIRLAQENDRLMLLMFEGLVDNKKEANLEAKLKNVDTLLSEQIDVKEKFEKLLSFNEYGDIINNEIDKKQIVKYISETRKRKEYSVLKRFKFDTRLAELFEYFEEDIIPMEKLKTEIESYNRTRDDVFDLVTKLEKVIVNKDLQGVLNEIEHVKSHIQHKPYLIWLLKKEIISQQEFAFMNMVRNTFSHNKFPQKSTMELFIDSWDDNRFADQILIFYKELINRKMIDIQNF